MTPAAEYERRTERIDALLQRMERRWRALAFLRVVAFVAAIAALLVPWQYRGLAVLPALIFIGTVIAHARIDARRRAQHRLSEWYRQALARLRGERSKFTAELPAPDPNHPYAIDLDILGENSVEQWLCHAQTAGGRATLTRWLSVSAPVEEVAARQEAVAELVEDLDGREQMLLLARPGAARDATHLRRWVEDSHRVAVMTALRTLAFILAIGLGAALAGWLAKLWTTTPLIALAAISFGFTSWCGRLLAPTLAQVERSAAELSTLHRLLSFVIDLSFECEKLRGLQRRMGPGAAAARRVRDLLLRLEMYDNGRNAVFAPLAVLWLWRTQWGLAIEAWRVRHGESVLDALEALSEYEALQSLARGAFESEGVRPTVGSGGPARLSAEGVAHPLLSVDVAVRNDVELDADGVALWIVSGSNMSGKSTLLRAVGVNAVLALAGGFVRAQRFEMTHCAVAASIRAGDSLLDGESRFAHELARLRSVVELAQGAQATLFLLDELLHGTHSHDRREGAAALLEKLLRGPTIGMVSTHDLELCKLEERLKGRARNVHFLDEAEELEDARFDFKLREGVVSRTNALRLMRRAGLFD